MEFQAPPPPVVNFERQARMADIVEGTPFSIFNIIAIVVIAIAGFFLYKRFMDKQATEKAHMLRPSSIIAQPETASIVTPTVDEVKDD